ncbi:DinB family protein [Mucilaginibacter celer]|uniref:DinB family protein n=1 Tax=Mucilaginibacter celer TaxID=2305508 RepID=A0A494VS65_9SPHI|nr:DinB family protein [Mucilaginibacter celer]AYL97289.1 DinB family protein [Mucilaginibacter celer]
MISERFECEILRASRTRLLQLIETTDYEILFKIPEGFNNNIIWQIGHCITSQQRHMYMRSGLPMHISEAFEESFKIGSSPRSWKIMPNVNEVKDLLIDTVNQLESDLESKLFVNYQPFELPIGFQVKNHIEALQAANYHEAEHSGKVFTYLKLLLKE